MKFAVERYAAKRWREWTGRHSRTLRTATIAPARHRNQKLTILLADGFGPHRVVAKVGRSPHVVDRIAAEHQVLIRARHELPAQLSARAPEPLDFVFIGDGAALFTAAVRGRRPVFPHLLSPTDRRGEACVEKYLATIVRWVTEIDAATRVKGPPLPDPAVAYLERFPQLQRAEEFAQLVGNERAWQHGDPALGNLILNRRDFGIVDWEHASSDKLPWHDLAYVVLQMALNAAHQADLRPAQALQALYEPGSWCGDLIQRYVLGAWQYPVGIPEGVTITAMALALERDDAADGWNELASSLVSGRGPSWLGV